jgi:uncharacterized protein YndB with AHSA1/START domain
VQAKIARPRDEVFDAVYNPEKLSRYFTTGGPGQPLREGTLVIWKFADYSGDIPVAVREVVPNERIVLEWAAGDHDELKDSTTRVEISFDAPTPDSTMVRISEGAWRETQTGLNASYANCQGWMNMLCCLKAWMEHGINLREGFFV